ncbi:SDR family NAD(P)-dependent oxidoreductase [Polynucleobacter bastaniensis]|uniref:SDR family NAD(P)-dependent oxidoreductase n=1 Tax=Polynucleobacter bastaniensis TaxID=2081039 RepID=UPI001C0ACEBA|nr:SDR family oxidoreductase [Polynucleobacter bastaniensis]
MINSMKIVVITGTSRGLGFSLALHYLKLGYCVVGCSKGLGTINHASYFHTSCNLTNEKEVGIWIRNIYKSFGSIDVLICNAGLVYSALYLSLTPSSVMNSFLNNNISAVFYVLREVSKIMVIKGFGRIITISSTMMALHEQGTAVYSATKSAVTEMTKVLANELAPRGITCNIVAPGMMVTDSSKELAQSLDWERQMLDKQVFKRVIGHDEISNATDFFISDLSKSITGQVIYLGIVK